MRIKLFQILLSLSSLLIFSVTGLSNTVQETPGFTDLTLEISTDKEQFVELEPIPIKLKLSNRTAIPILGHTVLEFSSHQVKLFVIHDGKREQIKSLTNLHCCGILRNSMIAPGTEKVVKELLYLELGKVFPNPGLYQLEAVLPDLKSKNEIKSSPLTIKIVKPKGIDLAAYNYMKNNSVPGHFFTAFCLYVNEREKNLMIEFAARFRTSIYGDYIAYILGTHYLHRQRQIEAIQLLEPISEHADFIYNDYVLGYLVQSYVELDDLTRAESYYKILASKYPNSSSISEAGHALWLKKTDKK